MFSVILQPLSVTLTYYTKDTPSFAQNATLHNIVQLDQNSWHHVAVVIYGREFTLFVDGNMARTTILSGFINDKMDTLVVGKGINGKMAFLSE